MCYELDILEICAFFLNVYAIAQCADSVVRNAFERTPYIVVLKFHVFILISKSFNFRSPLERILRYLTKNLILHSKFQTKSMLMTQYRLLSYRK